MKKIIFTLSVVCSIFTADNIQAQACGGTSNCGPQGGPPQGGFEESSTIPCAVQGVAYDHSIQFTMFSVFNFLGSQSVDSIEFNTVDNLPCGLCWSVNKPNKRYVANEDGCFNIKGTTSDSAGQYKLAVSVNAWINHGANAIPVNATLFDQTDIRIIFRVKTASGTCVTVDTAANAPGNLTASISCPPVGISELSSDFSSIRISPNPMNGDGAVSFTSAKASVYTLQVSDVAGKMVLVNQVEVKQGENSIAIRRSNLVPGIYFLTINDGKNTITNRFSVTE